jgi:hypothetical protein
MASLICLISGATKPVVAEVIFAADVDESMLNLTGIAGDDDPLDHAMWIVFHQDPILESPRLTLIGIADKVARMHILWQKHPLATGGKPCTTPAAQASVKHQLNNFPGLKFSQGFPQSLVAAPFDIGTNVMRVGDPHIVHQYV